MQADELKLQREEMKLQREESARQTDESVRRNINLELQQFDSTFFKMLNQNERVLESISYREMVGVDVLWMIYQGATNSLIRALENPTLSFRGVDSKFFKAGKLDNTVNEHKLKIDKDPSGEKIVEYLHIILDPFNIRVSQYIRYTKVFFNYIISQLPQVENHTKAMDKKHDLYTKIIASYFEEKEIKYLNLMALIDSELYDILERVSLIPLMEDSILTHTRKLIRNREEPLNTH